MMSRTVNVALLGAGEIGQVHAETLARHIHGARLAAVVDPVAANAERAASLGDDVYVAAKPGAVLANEGIDAVVIAAPARFHTGLIIAAATAGKHIFCEKPVALTLEDARRAVDAARVSAVKLQIGFQRRFDARYARAREAIVRGDIGKIERSL